MSFLRLQNIIKNYSSKRALDDVSFEVPAQCIFGLLGPNGAGKTTLIRIITQIIGADSGQVFMEDQPMHEQQVNVIGYMPEERGLYKKMKVGEVLVYLARLKNIPKEEAKNRVDQWLKRLELSDWKNKRVDELSKGMQQKVQFISTVIHQPKLIILDEPFSGLDPINTVLIKDEISELSKKGTTVIFSTHRMEQVEEICKKIVLINNGKKVLEGDVDEVRQRFKQNKFGVKYKDALPPENSSLFEVLEQKDHEIIVSMKNGNKPSQLLSYFIQNNVELVGFNEILPSLNEIFIRQVHES